MWVCAKCQEQSPDTFIACWRCETLKEGVAPPEPTPSLEPIPVAEPLEEPPPLEEPDPISSPAPEPSKTRTPSEIRASLAARKLQNRQSQVSVRPRWEYRWVTFGCVDSWDSEHVVYRTSSIDENEIEDWEEKGTDLSNYCNEAGNEGWELIAQSFDEDGILWVCFKRSKI